MTNASRRENAVTQRQIFTGDRDHFSILEQGNLHFGGSNEGISNTFQQDDGALSHSNSHNRGTENVGDSAESRLWLERMLYNGSRPYHPTRSFAKQGVLLFLVLLIITAVACRDSMYSPLNWHGMGAYVQKKLEHDFLIAEGILWLNAITGQLRQKTSSPSLQAYASSEGDDRGTSNGDSPCIVAIFNNERVVPYISVLVSSLYGRGVHTSIEQARFLNATALRPHFHLHILDTGSNEINRQFYFAQLQSLPNVAVHTLDELRKARGSPEENRSIEGMSKDEVYYEWLRRGISDYSLALDVCAKDKADWTIIVEEDAVVTSDFVQKFNARVAQPLASTMGNVAYVKLFASDKWDGFEDVDRVKVVTICALIAMLLLALFVLYQNAITSPEKSQSKPKIISLGCHDAADSFKRWVKQTPRPKRKAQLLRRFSLFFVYFFVLVLSLVLLIGKQQLKSFALPFFSGLVSPQHVMATVAIAYPTARLTELSEFLQEYLTAHSRPDPVDWVIGRSWWGNGEFPPSQPTRYKAYEVVPSLVQHIGAFSSGPVGAGKHFGKYGDMPQDSLFRF